MYWRLEDVGGTERIRRKEGFGKRSNGYESGQRPEGVQVYRWGAREYKENDINGEVTGNSFVLVHVYIIIAYTRVCINRVRLLILLGK